MSKRTSHIMSKKQVTCSVQYDKSYVMSNMTLKIIFISQFFNVPICTFLSSDSKLDAWFSQSCSLHISVHFSPFDKHTHLGSEHFHVQLQANKSRTAWGAGCSMEWMHHQLFNSFFLLNLPSSTNRTWYFRVLFKAASPYCGLVVGSLCMFH